MGRPFFARALLLVPALVCILTPVRAVADQRMLSLSQAVDYALRNNGELKSFREERGIREAGRVRAGILANPTLEMEAATGALTGSSDESTVAVGLSREFLLGGKRDKRIKIADAELETYRWQLADRERALRAEVASAFADAVLARERAGLADRAVETSRQLFEVTRERLAAGDIPELEFDLAKVELARSEGAKLEIETAVNQVLSRLAVVMGLPAGDYPAVAGGFDSSLAAGKTLVELKRLAGNRPDVRALEGERERADAETDLATAERIPNLTAGVVAARETSSIEVGGQEGKDTAYTIGVRLSMPIPLFDKNQAGIQEARARHSSAETRLAAARGNVEREVEAAYLGYLNSEKILSLYKSKIIPQLEENLKITQEAYRIGEVGILSVIQEQKKFFEVTESYLTAQHDRQTALVKLEAAVGSEITGGKQ